MVMDKIFVVSVINVLNVIYQFISMKKNVFVKRKMQDYLNNINMIEMLMNIENER